jgi:predicted nucleotidyltransferase
MCFEVDRYKVTKIGMFGSVARNDTNENSDVDIVVDMEPNILKHVNLKIELEQRFGRKVDVIRYWYGMNKYLKARIDREAIYA